MVETEVASEALVPHDKPPSGALSIRRLIERIQADGLRGGDRLPSIRDLSRQWGVAPHLVRDALLAAQTKGLVRVHPRAGAFVQSVNYESLVDALEDTLETAIAETSPRLTQLMDARALLEAEIMVIAVANRRLEDLDVLERHLADMATSPSREAFVFADEKFHLAIASLTGNPVLVTMLRSLLVLLRPHRLSSVPPVQTWQATNQTHQEIYRCLRDGDGPGIRAALEGHWGR